jgi:chromate transporter
VHSPSREEVVGDLAELAWRFVLVGALAFGGGSTALPLVERITVHETGWLSASDFSTGIALAYATPGPILILASFVGYRVAGLPGTLVATVCVFAVPVVLTASAARVVDRLSGSVRFRAFGRFAASAAIGLLGVTLVALAHPLLNASPLLLLGSGAVLIAAVRDAPPLALLAAAGVLGALGANW